MAKSDANSGGRPERLPTGPSSPTDRGDRSRLEQIQQTDVTEGRYNEDFLDWLKTKGLNYAAVILLVLVGVMGWNMFKDRRVQERDQAWVDLSGASLPGSLEDVAQRHRDTDSIAPWALLDAAERYYQAVQRGVRLFDREPDAEDWQLTPELREQWLNESDRLFSEVVAKSRGSRSHDRRGFLIAALFGRAAIAESRGDAEAARAALSEIASVSRGTHQAIADLAESRMANLDEVIAVAKLPSRSDLPAAPSAQPLVDPIVTDDLLRDLLTPSGGNSGGE